MQKSTTTPRATVAMPGDTNPAGDVFGSWLLAQMDLAASSAATRRARGRCATVAVEAIAFHPPVRVGDELSFYAEILTVGRTSIRIVVEAWSRGRDSDDYRVPRAIPPAVAIVDLAIVETRRTLTRFASALSRIR